MPIRISSAAKTAASLCAEKSSSVDSASGTSATVGAGGISAISSGMGTSIASTVGSAATVAAGASNSIKGSGGGVCAATSAGGPTSANSEITEISVDANATGVTISLGNALTSAVCSTTAGVVGIGADSGGGNGAADARGVTLRGATAGAAMGRFGSSPFFNRSDMRAMSVPLMSAAPHALSASIHLWNSPIV